MNCEQANQLLSEFYDGELEVSLATEVATHVAQCKVCENELANFKTIGAMIQSSKNTQHSTSITAPTWDQFVASLELADRHIPARKAVFSSPKFALAGAAVLAASTLFLVSLNVRKHFDSATHQHNYSDAGDSTVVIDFEQLLNEEPNQPIATLVSLTNRFEGHEADLDDSESQLGYRPSISQALPSGVKLVSNRVLKLPHCNCETGACTCGPAGCNCAASLCKRVDGSEFLVVEHCATQNVSFGHPKTELLRAEKSEVQLMSVGTQLVASWIADRRRLTAIGLNDNSEAQTIVASLSAR